MPGNLNIAQNELRRRNRVGPPNSGNSGNSHRGKFWCFTLNNWTEAQKTILCGLVDAGKASYLCFGEEIAESGTRHLQGYLELRTRQRTGQVSSLLESAHVEPRRGNATQAKQYCEKDGLFSEFGEMSKVRAGQRTDLIDMVDYINAVFAYF